MQGVQSGMAEIEFSEVALTKAQLADLLLYASAGAESLEAWEPYGLMTDGLMTCDEWESACERAESMLDRLKAGEFGPLSGAREKGQL